jgi:transglutaminase-like putative cysteine protease
MRIIPLILSFILVGFSSLCQDYNVALISDSLKQNANAVKRYEELRIIIKSPKKAVIKHKYAITILNEAGDEYCRYANSYDKLQSLSDIHGTLYDANGKEIKSIKKKDLSDLAYNDEISLMTDNRIKTYTFYYKQYPYTVEFEDEQEFDGIFYLPSWTPLSDEKFAVEQSRLVVETPADFRIRYKQFNYAAEPDIKKDKVNTYTWEVRNLKSIEFEPFQTKDNSLVSVYVAPLDFEIGGYKGSMETWESLGKFIVQLNMGKDQLPENVKADIHALVEGVTSVEKKIELLYNYLQKNTRYISIQLGIGGWQPFEAKYVATKRYGDCKALSNYMISLLKEAGVNANYVLINAGEGKKGLWDDFPAPYFNHAIMCVPNGKDTIWLECTSQTVSPGFMGSFTGDRKALVITQDGGKVVATPHYSSKDNSQIRKVTATVDLSGNVIAEMRTVYSGIAQEDVHGLIHQATKEQREKYLNSTLGLPTYSIEAFDHKEVRGRIPSVDEYLKVAAPNYATITGKRLFIQPNIFSKNYTKLNTDKVRKFPIEYTSSFMDIDTATISIPEGYQPEAMPKDVLLTNKFGKYSISFKVDANKIIVHRHYERQAATYPASDYLELAKFYEDIYKADRSKIVLVKKE